MTEDVLTFSRITLFHSLMLLLLLFSSGKTRSQKPLKFLERVPRWSAWRSYQLVNKILIDLCRLCFYVLFLNTKTKSHSSYCSFPIHLDDGFNKKQRHLKAQAFAIKMRPRKETLEVNFVSVISSFHCVECQN